MDEGVETHDAHWLENLRNVPSLRRISVGSRKLNRIIA